LWEELLYIYKDKYVATHISVPELKCLQHVESYTGLNSLFLFSAPPSTKMVIIQ